MDLGYELLNHQKSSFKFISLEFPSCITTSISQALKRIPVTIFKNKLIFTLLTNDFLKQLNLKTKKKYFFVH